MNYEDSVTKPTLKELVKAEPVVTAEEHTIAVEVRREISFGFLEAVRDEIHRVRSKNRGQKAIIFMSRSFYSDVVNHFNPHLPTLQDLCDNGVLLGCDVRVFDVPPQKNYRPDKNDFYVCPV